MPVRSKEQGGQWLGRFNSGESGRKLVHRGNGRMLGRAGTAVPRAHCTKAPDKEAGVSPVIQPALNAPRGELWCKDPPKGIRVFSFLQRHQPLTQSLSVQH